MNDETNQAEKLSIVNSIDSKLTQLSAIVSSLIALGLSAANADSLPFIPDDARTTDTFLALGDIANKLHEELILLNEQLLTFTK